MRHATRSTLSLGTAAAGLEITKRAASGLKPVYDYLKQATAAHHQQALMDSQHSMSGRETRVEAPAVHLPVQQQPWPDKTDKTLIDNMDWQPPEQGTGAGNE